MAVKIGKVQVLVSHYHSVLVCSNAARERVGSWGLNVEREMRSAGEVAAELRKLEAAGRKEV